MNNKDLEKLFEMLSETDIYEFELEKPNSIVKIKRGPVPQQVSVAQLPAHPLSAPAPVAAPATPEEPEDKRNLKYIVSEMVGIFYRASSPDSQPYIEKGDKVTKGQVMCMIEAMKTFSEISSDISGTVVEVLLENGKPVEFGEKLFAIEVS